MSTTQRFKVRFGWDTTPEQRAPLEEPVSRLARQLALAYQIEAWLDEGVVKNYAEVARRLGLTDARVTQVCDLALLSTRVQEDVLLGRLIVDPKRAQRATRHLVWEEQERELRELVEKGVTRKTGRRWE